MGFMLAMLTLLQERSRDQADTVLPERKHLNSATRAIPEWEGTRALALALCFSTFSRWPPQDGQHVVPCQSAARSGVPCCPEVRADRSLAAEGRTARRASEY